MTNRYEEVQKYLDECICKSGNPYPTIEDLNRYISAFFSCEKLKDEVAAKKAPANALEGYTFDDINNLHCDPFGKDSIIMLQQLPEEDYDNIPILRQFKHLIQILHRDGSIKYDRHGCLPNEIVLELYPLGVQDELLDFDFLDVIDEVQLMSIRILKLLLEESELVKKKKNVLTFTKEGYKMAVEASDSQLFCLILNIMVFKINKGYFDDYNSLNIGNWGFGYTLLLLAKYGDVVRDNHFYSEKYFAAYPELTKEINGCIVDDLPGYDCYFIRVFRAVLEQLGLVDIQEYLPSEDEDVCIEIMKTTLFDKLFKLK